MTRGSSSQRLLDRTAGWMPIVLLAALAALTWWLDAQITGDGGRGNGNKRHDPDLIIEGVRAVELDKAGRPVQIIAAQVARHFPDDGTVEFEQPHIVVTQPDRPRFTVQSERGRISADRENVWFEGNVRAEREAESRPDDQGNTAGPVRLVTEYLHVIPRKDRAMTDRPVTIEESHGIIRATGLELDNQAHTLKLISKVQGTLQPGDK